MLIDIEPEVFDDVLAAYLRKCIESIAADNGELFEGDDKKKLLDAMKLTHDWFARPSDWYFQ